MKALRSSPRTASPPSTAPAGFRAAGFALRGNRLCDPSALYLVKRPGGRLHTTVCPFPIGRDVHRPRLTRFSLAAQAARIMTADARRGKQKIEAPRKFLPRLGRGGGRQGIEPLIGFPRAQTLANCPCHGPQTAYPSLAAGCLGSRPPSRAHGPIMDRLPPPLTGGRGWHRGFCLSRTNQLNFLRKYPSSRGWRSLGVLRNSEALASVTAFAYNTPPKGPP